MCALTCEVTFGLTAPGPVGCTRMPPLAKWAAMVTTRTIRTDANAQSVTDFRNGSWKT